MANNGQMNPEETKIQAMIAGYLVSGAASKSGDHAGSHLDEDSIAAFTEGNLSELEARPIVSHLVDCSYCLHVTAEIIRLDAAFAEQEIAVPAMTAEPARISDVLSNLFSKIFGTNDGAVFAHEEKDEDEEDKKEDPEKTDN